MNILTVEDDAAIREAISEVLSFAGYKVSAASQGIEALDLLKGGLLPRVILLDLMMPLMNGWQFLDEVRKDSAFAEIPIVIISAVSPEDYVGKFSNVKHIIRKPVIIEQLLMTVKSICDNSTANP